MLLAHLEYLLDASILTQRTLRLRIGAADVAQACDRVADKLRKQVQTGGFRKGKAPLAVVRRELWNRVSSEAFQELKRAALDQVYEKLEPQDRPFLPPSVLNEDKLKLRYGQNLEFAVKYLLDPSGVTRNPAQPEFEQGAVMPGASIKHAAQIPGIPGMPQLPQGPEPQ